MKQIHKKAFFTAGFLAAVFAGTVLALFPAWERYREQGEQEALLLRLEQKADTDSQEEGQDIAVVDFSIPHNMDALLQSQLTGMKDVVMAGTKNIDTAAGGETVPETDKMKLPEAGAEIGILTIPKIDARLPVTAGVSEAQLKVSEGWLMQTAPIGSVGNAVIAGHRSYTWGRHFNRLEELETGDEIFYITTDGEEMRFLVSEILTVDPDDPAVFFTPSDGMAQLTLYTCTPVKIATHRLIVRALRMEE